MKVSITERLEEEFKPFDLIIRVGSLNELKSLFQRFNLSDKEAQKNGCSDATSKANGLYIINTLPIFEVLDKELDKYCS